MAFAITIHLREKILSCMALNRCPIQDQKYEIQHSMKEKNLKHQGRIQNLKEVPQNFMKVLNVDDVTLSSQIMASQRKVNIASEKIINYRVTSPSNNICQIRILAGERPGISVIICCFPFARQEQVHVNVSLHKILCIKTPQ